MDDIIGTVGPENRTNAFRITFIVQDSINVVVAKAKCGWYSGDLNPQVCMGFIESRHGTGRSEEAVNGGV